LFAENIIAGSPLTRLALKVLEPCAGKLACTVLRGRKLPGYASVENATRHIDTILKIDIITIKD
jgi:hypothetical protein